MTSDNGIHIGKPPFFDGNNYDYWKTRMSAHLKAMSRKLWRVVSDGYVILDQGNLLFYEHMARPVNSTENNLARPAKPSIPIRGTCSSMSIWRFGALEGDSCNLCPRLSQMQKKVPMEKVGAIPISQNSDCHVPSAWPFSCIGQLLLNTDLKLIIHNLI